MGLSYGSGPEIFVTSTRPVRSRLRPRHAGRTVTRPMQKARSGREENDKEIVSHSLSCRRLLVLLRQHARCYSCPLSWFCRLIMNDEKENKKGDIENTFGLARTSTLRDSTLPSNILHVFHLFTPASKTTGRC